MWWIIRYYKIIQKYILIFLSFRILFFISCQESSRKLTLFNVAIIRFRNHLTRFKETSQQIISTSSRYPSALNSKSKVNLMTMTFPHLASYSFPYPCRCNTQMTTTFQKKTQLVCSVAQDICYMKPLHLKNPRGGKWARNLFTISCLSLVKV